MENELKSYAVGSVIVTKHLVDWNDLEGGVRQRLVTADITARVYLNPEFTVKALNEAPLQSFVKQARRAQVLWNKRLSRVLGAANRRRALKHADPQSRQLGFTGVMILSGKPVHPQGWPDVETKKR